MYDSERVILSVVKHIFVYGLLQRQRRCAIDKRTENLKAGQKKDLGSLEKRVLRNVLRSC